MDLLIWTLISGGAVAFAIEFINNTIGSIFWRRWSDRLVRLILTLPLSYGAAWLLGVSWPSIVVVVLAAGFFSNALLILLERSRIVISQRR